MLKVYQYFMKHYSCHLQGECFLWGTGVRKPYINQAVVGEWHVTRGTEEQGAIQLGVHLQGNGFFFLGGGALGSLI
jgi:hypothetical protein